MKHYYSLFLLIAMLPTLVLANNGKFKGKYTKEKKIHKEFDVNANAGLQIDNSFGNIDIVSWNQNKIVIDVIIKTNGNNEAKVSERLNEITVAMSGSGSKVVAKTNFKKNKSSWNSWWGTGKSNIASEINYIIKMPVTNTLNVSNDYGTITIDKLEGHAKISCDFGQLNIGELLAENNYLSFDHGGNSTIKYIKSGKISADHYSISIDKAGSLELMSDNTKTNIGEVMNLNYNNDYGKISIGKVTNLVGRGDHINHNIGSVSGSLDINTDYGGISVGMLEAGFKSVVIQSEYASVKLGLASGCTFDISANITRANFKGRDLFTFTKQHEDLSESTYQGYMGAQGSGNTITINSNHGSITFKKQ